MMGSDFNVDPSHEKWEGTYEIQKEEGDKIFVNVKR